MVEATDRRWRSGHIWDHESQSAFETMSDYQKEGDRRVRYAHIGTGNFNEKTARTYTDFSLLTAHPEITSEVRQVFSFIKAPYRSYSFRHLWLSPTTQREQIYHRIDREIDNAKSGKRAQLTLKVNNLADDNLVEKLYEASRSGVRIRACVRGMYACSECVWCE